MDLLLILIPDKASLAFGRFARPYDPSLLEAGFTTFLCILNDSLAIS